MISKQIQRAIITVVVCTALASALSAYSSAQTVDFLAQFSNVQTNATPLVQATDGNFYGSTVGSNTSADSGSIFRMTPTGDLTTIYTFCSQACASITNPDSSPILGSDGNLYGVVRYGGNSTGSGTFYRMTLDGQMTTLYTFCPAPGCADGQVPSGIILATDGNFYGTTELGGAHNAGTFFRISPTGALKVLHSFCSQANCADGGGGANVIQGVDGNFYSIGGGGTLGGGVFYQVKPSGSYKVLYNFCAYTDTSCTGSYPTGIVQDSKGNFFGTAQYGGNSNYGTVFEIAANTFQYHVLYSFSSNRRDDPAFGVTLANDENLYGIAIDSGVGANAGTLFKVTTKGAYTALYTFNAANGPYDPWYGLVQGTGGLLYGTTLYGSGACCYGSIFSLDNGLKPLVNTVPTGGKVGKQVLILGNNLIGTSSVKFNGTEAKFTVESDTYIKATVPAGATTGVVSVVTPTGTLNSNPQFVVTK